MPRCSEPTCRGVASVCRECFQSEMDERADVVAQLRADLAAARAVVTAAVAWRNDPEAQHDGVAERTRIAIATAERAVIAAAEAFDDAEQAVNDTPSGEDSEAFRALDRAVLDLRCAVSALRAARSEAPHG